MSLLEALGIWFLLEALDEDGLAVGLLFVTTGFDDEAVETVDGCCGVGTVAVDSFVSLFFVIDSLVEVLEDTSTLSVVVFPIFGTSPILLLWGVKDLFGFLSTVTLSFPPSFFLSNAGDFDDSFGTASVAFRSSLFV